METDESSGGRYIAVSETAWFIEMARAIRERLGAKARRAPRFELPNFVVRLVGVFDAQARASVPDLGAFPEVDNALTRKALGMKFRPLSESVPATAESLIRLGLV